MVNAEATPNGSLGVYRISSHDLSLLVMQQSKLNMRCQYLV